MGDIRFTMVGIALIFAGFIILGVFGSGYQSAVVELDEFGTCYAYSEDAEPVPVSCEIKMGEQAALFGVVVAFIGAGIASLIKGARGDWDSRVRPEDMVGPDRSDAGGVHDYGDDDRDGRSRRGYDSDSRDGDGGSKRSNNGGA